VVFFFWRGGDSCIEIVPFELAVSSEILISRAKVRHRACATIDDGSMRSQKNSGPYCRFDNQFTFN
jgi:hypothetical protein